MTQLLNVLELELEIPGVYVLLVIARQGDKLEQVIRESLTIYSNRSGWPTHDNYFCVSEISDQESSYASGNCIFDAPLTEENR